MKTGRKTEEFTPGLKAGAWESSAAIPTHTEFQTGAESVKIRRKSLARKGVILQMHGTTGNANELTCVARWSYNPALSMRRKA